MDRESQNSFAVKVPTERATKSVGKIERGAASWARSTWLVLRAQAVSIFGGVAWNVQTTWITCHAETEMHFIRPFPFVFVNPGINKESLHVLRFEWFCGSLKSLLLYIRQNISWSRASYQEIHIRLGQVLMLHLRAMIDWLIDWHIRIAVVM